jgi:hypothetical protein
MSESVYMKKLWQNYKFATLFVTAYLIIYTLIHQFGGSLKVLGTMFLLSPFLVVWMAYTIIKHAPYNGKELNEDEEWGYGDKDKNDLGVF